MRRSREPGLRSSPLSPKSPKASTTGRWSVMAHYRTGTCTGGTSGDHEGVGGRRDDDVIVELKGGYLTSNGRLLMKHSARIKDILESQPMLKNGKGVVMIPTLEVDLFRIINEWLHNSKSLPKDLTLDECLKLLNPARIFKISKLRMLLVAKIKRILASTSTNEDVFMVLQVAKKEETRDLYEHTIGLICQRPMTFLFTEEFRNLQLCEVKAILESENLQVHDEMQVFKAAIGWAQTMAEKSRVDITTMSYFFTQVLACVRVPLLLPDQVEKLITQNQFDGVVSGIMERIVAAMRREDKKAIGKCSTVKKLGMKWWKRGEEMMVTNDLDETVSDEDGICCVEDAVVPRNEGASQSSSSSPSSEEMSANDVGAETNNGNVGGGGAQDDESSSIGSDETSEDVQIPEPNGDDGESVMEVIPGNEDASQSSSSSSEGMSVDEVGAETNIDDGESAMEVLDTVTGVNVAETGRCEIIDIVESDSDDCLQLEKLFTPQKAQAESCRLLSCFEDEDECSNDGTTDVSDPSDPIGLVIKNPPNKIYSSFNDLKTSVLKAVSKEISEPVKYVELVNFHLTSATTKVARKAHITVDGTFDCIKGENVSDRERIRSLLRFIRKLDVTNYLVFTPNSRVVNVEDIWDLEQQILLRFNGITFLSVDHNKEEIILNYMKDCKRILSGCKGEVTSIALSNCEWNMAEESEQGSKLKKLSMYRVWGDFGLRRILREYPNMEDLRIWKWTPCWKNKAEFPNEYSHWLVLSVPFENFSLQNLRVLVVEKLKIKLRNFFELGKIVQTNIEILKLERSQFLPGNSDVHICELLPRLFPRLKRLWMIGILESEDGYEWDTLSEHSVCGAAMSIPSLEWLRVKDLTFEDEEGNCNCKKKVKALLENAGCPDSGDFLLTRTVASRISRRVGGWIGTCYESMKSNRRRRDEYEDMNDTMEMEWHKLDMFYKDLAAFQDYFIQSGVEGDKDEELKFPVRKVSYF